MLRFHNFHSLFYNIHLCFYEITLFKKSSFKIAINLELKKNLQLNYAKLQNNKQRNLLIELPFHPLPYMK